MIKNYIVLVLAILFTGITIAQEAQKNFINYQGVARNADSQLMASEAMMINIALKFGAANTAAVYEESHTITTDANGVFSLLIGNGNSISGNYNSLPWGSAATFVSVSMNGNEIGTTELMAVPYAISSGDADDQSAAEVAYDNTISGLTATTTQAAIDELATDGSVDTDADPENEFQTLSFDAGTNELSLSDGNAITIPTGGTDGDADATNEIQILGFDAATNELSLTNGGGSVSIPSGGTDADADPANEFQTLSFDVGTNALSLSDGNSVTIPSGGTDADADPTNEIQTISFDVASNTISLTDGGEITIPSGGTDADADPENEIDVTRRHGLLIGDDGIVDGLIGTADGQVAKWDAALGNWVAGTDETGGAGGSSLWTENGDKIYYNTGNVGIGAANPIGKLQISKNSNSAPFLNLHSTSGDEINVRYSKMENSLNWNQHAVIGTDEASSRMDFNFYDRGTDHPIITLRGHRKMGVNNSNPQSTLDVNGNIRSSDLTGVGQRNVIADADGNLVIGAGGGGSSLWSENGGHINYDTGRVGIGTGVDIPVTRMEIAGIPGVSEEVGFTNALFTITDNEFGGGPFRLIMGGSSIQTTAAGVLSSLLLNPEGGNVLTGSGDVGIGISPTAKLDVNGTVRSRDLEGTGQRNVMADADGKLVIGAGGGGEASGLAARDEGNGLGWRLIGSDPDNFGNIGENAVGLSQSAGLFAMPETRGATGKYSFTAGYETTASNFSATAFGADNEASGSSAFVMNRNNVAEGDYSLAAGRGTKALGEYGVSMGFETQAESYTSFALGRRNVGGGNPNAWEPTDPLFEIGNGTSVLNRRNALTVLKNGNTGIGTAVPSAELEVKGTIKSSILSGGGNVVADADGNLVIGAGGGGSSLWAENGDKIHYNLGNAGIGTDDPLAPLHIITSAINPLRIESTSADNYIRFSNTNGYRGYVGVFSNDNDMDFGTGVGNTTGKVHLTTLATPRLTLAADGKVGIGTTAPTAKLDVDGDIKTSGEVHSDATGSANMIPIAYGYIDAAGNILSGSGNFTVDKLEPLLGLYLVTIPTEDNPETWIVLTTFNHTAPGIVSVSHSGSGARRFNTNTWRLNSTRIDASFSFVVYKP